MPRRGEEELEGLQELMNLQQQALQAGKVILPAITAGATAGFLIVAYYFIQQDRSRPNSVTKDDSQVGIKLVLYALALTALTLAVGGASSFLGYALGGFKGGSATLKAALPPVLVGGGATAAILFAFLPKTNAATQKQPLRFFLGALAVQHAALAILALNDVLTGLFTDAPWALTSRHLAVLIVEGAVGFYALLQFGKISGWTMAPPAAQYPPQAGGGGGYPPQGGGGYPPQGGGGYQQGGGYPQQGGGGYPQQGGGSGSYGGGGSGGYPPPA
jgi:hypothetical protein